MKYILTIMFAIAFFVNADAQTTKTIYTCPMHPEVQQAAPGKCPKCGMDLVAKKVTVKAAAKPVQNPPAKKPAPKAAPTKKDMPPMKDMQKPTAEMQHNQMPAMPEADVKYTCPMHAEVVSDKPGSCPKCGMDLVQKKKENNQNKSHQMHTDFSADENADKISFQGKTVRYDLYVTDTTVNFTGKKRHAYAINGQIPAPVLYFTEGDTAEIYLHNRLKKEETSLHWHGVILPNWEDGVPYLTTKRIGPGETHLYKFKVVQNGTYWYHSHSGLQEQAGLYGTLIFRKRDDGAMENKYAAVLPLMLSEWTDEKPNQVMRRLHTANDWYAIKKGSVQSYAEAIKHNAFGTKLKNEWLRMKAMDVSDVYYDKFLINGKTEQTIETVPSPLSFGEGSGVRLKAGDKVRLRVVNGGASSYFWLNYGGGKITVVANDGNDVEPVEVDRLIVGVSETYDVVVTIPENMRYEFRATPEDRTKYASIWLGSGMKMPAPELPRLNYFEGMKMMNDMMKMNGDMKDMGMNMSLQTMDMNQVMYPELHGSQPMKHDMGNMEQSATPQDHSMHNMASTDTAKIQDHSMHPMQQYTCPMHPEVVSDKPGKCPKCGMALVPKAPSPSERAGGEAHEKMDMSTVNGIRTLNYDLLKSPEKTAFPPDAPVHKIHFTLEGNMNRYLWSLDNKTVLETDKIMIKKGEILRLVLTNNSMMRHPMHLHGHDFRVLNSKGEYSPLKNVIDILPMETDTIEFAANQDGDWFFHCHILYHMMAGMGRIFSYQNSEPNPQLPNKAEAWRLFKKDNRMTAFKAQVGLESNGSDGEFMWMSHRYALNGDWHIGIKPEHGYEGSLIFGRYLGKMQWAYPYIGAQYRYKPKSHGIEKNLFGQETIHKNYWAPVAGFQYTLPWLIVADARIDMYGKIRFQLMREDIPITPRLRFNWMVNTDKEYMVGFRYITTKWLALSTHYDSDMGYGAGITIIY